MTRSPGGFCRWGSFLPAHSFALSFLRKRTSELLITVSLAHKFCRRTGAVLPLTGEGAVYGQRTKKGMQLALIEAIPLG